VQRWYQCNAGISATQVSISASTFQLCVFTSTFQNVYSTAEIGGFSRLVLSACGARKGFASQRLECGPMCPDVRHSNAHCGFSNTNHHVDGRAMHWWSTLGSKLNGNSTFFQR